MKHRKNNAGLTLQLTMKKKKKKVYPEWYVYSLLNMRKGVTNIFCLRFLNFFPFFF